MENYYEIKKEIQKKFPMIMDNLLYFIQMIPQLVYYLMIIFNFIMSNIFEGKKILITGGTGSLGTALTKKLLGLNIDTIRIFSRNESKQIEMESKFDDERIRYFLGDIRDYNRLVRAVEDVDIVFHTAALKHVPKIEYNPFEAIKTNVIGSQNVIDACIETNVSKAI